MVPGLRRGGEPPPEYGDDDEEFSVEVHHGGFFVGQGKNRAYVDGKVNWFDHCEVDTWSPLWLADFVFALHYPNDPALKFYWLLPGKDLGDGLRAIVEDSDTLVMASLVHKFKNFVLYLDHDDTLNHLNWDDIVANPVSSLPKVLSPQKVAAAKDEKLPAFYQDVPCHGQEQGQEQDGQFGEGSDDSTSEDSDFVDSDYEVEADDDDLFFANVDDQVTDEGVAKGKKIASQPRFSSGVADEALDTDEDDDDLHMPGSDGEGDIRLRFKSFKPEDISNPKFKVGMLFESVEMLRKAVTEYSIKERVEIKLPRNERKRYEAVCAGGCSWNLYASVDSRAHGMVIKRYHGEHTCQKKWVLKRCTSRWLADKYIESFRVDQKMSLSNFARIIQKDWNLTPSKSKIARARRLAMQKVLGDEAEQYKHLWDYGQELRRSNPGSTFFLKLNGSLFSTLYMAIDACKRGFLSACRPIICLDGCHIKTKYGGTILTAVGIDPNDCIYPIAIAIVEVECLLSWKWFLQTLKEDLGMDNTSPWTIMTDKQKGLIPAVQQVFPDSEHRFCVRHLYSNFQQHFKGENLKNQLWSCARSSSVSQWNRNMDKMKELDQKAYEWLEKMPPQTWVRAFFSTFPKCDILLNNMCEVFNNYILEAREMPILSMLETIKTQLMTRYYTKERDVGEEWQDPICPKIRKKLNKNSEWANTCYAMLAGNGIFQVQSKDYSFIVDIVSKKCDCRRWDLTGIPCSHAISCLRHERIAPESVIPDCYSATTYLVAYGQTIWPCKDKTEWEKVDAEEILPPVYEKKVGRPPKSRRKQPYEVEGKFSKHGVIITCRYCGQEGHNRGGCELRKAGLRPKLQAQRNPGPQHEEEQDGAEEITDQGPPDSQIHMSVLSQLSNPMVSQMQAESSQTRTVEQQPLPDSIFIATNAPAERPIPPTTATKSGRAAASKRKTEAAPKKTGATKKPRSKK